MDLSFQKKVGFILLAFLGYPLLGEVFKTQGVACHLLIFKIPWLFSTNSFLNVDSISGDEEKDTANKCPTLPFRVLKPRRHIVI
jgi:hypothetical protein